MPGGIGLSIMDGVRKLDAILDLFVARGGVHGAISYAAGQYGQEEQRRTREC